MSAITLELPLPPNMANGRGHWRVRYRAQLAYNDECLNRYRARLLPKVPNVPPPSVIISATLYLWAHMDDDNALARIKHAADFCKQAGYIVDDKRPHCRFTIPEQFIDRTNQRLVLTITPQES
jgi:predicted short-subunit dehydrogenase-like oxidoreductase (DUF2520 family)